MEPWLERAAALRPDRAAVEAPDGVITCAQLLGHARGVAGALAARGVRCGDRVALALPSAPEPGDAAGLPRTASGKLLRRELA